MRALGQSCGIDAVTLADDGGCTLSFDHLIVHFELDMGAAAVVVSTMLVDIPANADASLLKRLLQAN